MSSSKSAFSKFTLKPSALSQHTANFNKLLEQIPVPKIESIQLVKPIDHINESSNDLNLKKSENNSKENDVNSAASTETSEISSSTKSEVTSNEEATPKAESASTAPPITEKPEVAASKEFVFGEKLTDRVINAAPEGVNEDLAKDENGASESTTMKQSASGSQWFADTDEKYSSADTLENDANTIMKLNCKLFVLESNKANWAERGYGIFKLIDLNDGYNCKLMMWTDKCFRLILNTKLFEKMQIDRANKKAIRFNAFDNGTIRIFLVKTANPNDCDELFEVLKIRLNEFNEHIAENNLSKRDDDGIKSPKTVSFECDCELFKDSLSTNSIKARLRLYSFASSSSTANNPSSNNHQLLLDLVSPNDVNEIHLSTYLKLVRLKSEKQNKKDSFEFEINESFISSKPTETSSNSKEKYRVLINDKESVLKFLSFHSKEPKFKTNVDDSSEDDDNNNSDEEAEDSESSVNDDYDEKIRKSNSVNESERVASSEDGTKTNLTNEDSFSQENVETGEPSRKRKSEEDDDDSSSPVQNTFKKQELEHNQDGNNSKRIIDETSENDEESDKNIKKTKISNDSDDGQDS